MKKLCLILACLATLASGCAGLSTPKTSIRFLPATGQLTIQSPKDIDIQNFSLNVQKDGQFSISFSNYTSHNNPDVIAGVAKYNAEMLKAVSDVSGQFFGATLKAAK